MSRFLSKKLGKRVKETQEPVGEAAESRGSASPRTHEDPEGTNIGVKESKRGLGVSMLHAFSGRKATKAKQADPPTEASSTKARDQETKLDTLTPLPPATLLSTQTKARFRKEVIEPERQKEMLDMGIKAISLCQAVAEVMLPKYVSTALQKVAELLGVVRKMVENREAWKELITSIEAHQAVFNEQLRRMKKEDIVPDPDSPLLAPIKLYASALEKLTAEILYEAGLVDENAAAETTWEKVKKFSGQFLHVETEKESIQEYVRQLSRIMEQFKMTLQLFTSFAVNDIYTDVAGISSQIQAATEKLEGMHDRLILSLEPHDTIGARNITVFGGQHDTCLDGTRVAILDEINAWALSDSHKQSVYCIADVAGTGKSTIAKTLATQWYNSKVLAAMFFFSQEGSSVRTASDFCFSVASQIEELYDDPGLAEHWKAISKGRANLRERDIQEQWRRLVLQPFELLSRERTHLLLIDALDECTESTRGPLLRCILNAVTAGSIPHVRFLVTTRNEPDIRLVIQDENYRDSLEYATLRRLRAGKGDVAFYITQRLGNLGVFQDAPEQLSSLIERCDGLFIFASLACKLLEDACSDNQPLEEILQGFTSLDALYHQALTRADKIPRYTRSALKSILGLVVVAKHPLSISSIVELLPPSLGSVDVPGLLSRLGSVVTSGGLEDPVYIVHATFTEFLLRQNWVTKGSSTAKNEYAISSAHDNSVMAQSCLRILLAQLKFNICDLPPVPDPSDGRGSIPVKGNSTENGPLLGTDSGRRREHLRQHASASLRYAAGTWISHTIPALHNQDVVDAIRTLFRTKLLNWIEFGSIGEKVPDYMISIHRLQDAFGRTLSLSNYVVCEDDVQWCSDILEFLQSNQDLLTQLPLQVYSSALTFTPRQSQIYQAYTRVSLPEIVVGHPTRISGALPLIGHTAWVQAVTYSADGGLVVSAAGGGGIVVWDARTGGRQWQHELEGEKGECRGIRVPPGSRMILSVWTKYSGDGQEYARLYRLDCETKGLLCPQEDLDISGELRCISWAPDPKRFACGTGGGRIHLFTIEARPQRSRTVDAHERTVTSLSFSREGLKMASTSWDKTIKIWSLSPEGITGSITVWKHTKEVWNGAFSPTDSSLFAFVDDNSLHIYNIGTNTIDLSFECGVFAAHGVVYSHDGKQIAVRGGSTIQIINTVAMDQNNAQMVRELDTGHTGAVLCLAFSPDGRHLVTGCDDHSLRIHDLAITAPRATATGHREKVYCLSFSLDRRWLASVGWNGTLCNWNLESGILIQDAVQTGMLFPQVAISSDGSIVACAGRTDNIRFWDREARKWIGAKLSLVYPEVAYFCTMAFSPDDTKLAITTPTQIVLLDIQTIHELSNHPFISVKLDFNPRGILIAFHPRDYLCCGDYAWDLTNSPPNRVTSNQLSTLLEETSPIFRFNEVAVPSSSISLGSPTRQVFYIPPDFHVTTHNTHDGRIALGAIDGRIIALDFTHLAAEEEKVLLDRINTMGDEKAARSGPSRLYELLTSYLGPPKIIVPVGYEEKENHSNSGRSENEKSEDGGTEAENVERA